MVAHSGAGPLIPAVREALRRSVAGYIFVDAGLPRRGPRLPPGSQFEEYLRPILEAGKSWPDWSDHDVAELVPNAERRRRLLAELRPRDSKFWAEPIPDFPQWPDAPCAYVLWSSPYADEAAEAKRRGWLCIERDAAHFHQVVDPDEVADDLVALAQEMQAGPR